MVVANRRTIPIVGRWDSTEKKGEWTEYFPDNTFTDESATSGRWLRLKDGRLKVDATQMGMSVTILFDVKLEGGVLTLKEQKAGKTYRYHRHNSAVQASTAATKNPGAETTSILRQLATAVEAYGVDFNRYPAAKNITELSRIVSPTYVKVCPTKDGWGHPVEYVVDSKGQN